MTVHDYADMCEVEYITTHAGHETGDAALKHLFLTAETRQWIESRLRLGVSAAKILQEAQLTLKQDVKRDHLLKRKDIHNTAVNAQLTYVRHENDYTSVEAFVADMQSKGEENPVILFESGSSICSAPSDSQPEGSQQTEMPAAVVPASDFMIALMNTGQAEMLMRYGTDIVVMDSTHGTNAYGFQMTTVMVIDNFRKGFTVAHLFSSRLDTHVLSVFFSTIREKVGQIKCKTLMTDDFPAFETAWSSKMSKPEHTLLCSWHVLRAWKKQSHAKIKNKDDATKCFQDLQRLQKETDAASFDRLLEGFLSSYGKRLGSDVCLTPSSLSKTGPESRYPDFGKYFDVHYLKRLDKWAYCKRLNLGINTSMHVESFHRTFKNNFLSRKANHRLDVALQAVMEFTRHEQYNRLRSLYLGDNSTKLAIIRSHHKESNQMDEMVIQLPDDEDGNKRLLISDFTVYLLTKKCTCPLQCNVCNICMHTSSCECIDFSVKHNLCKHVHYARRITGDFVCQVPSSPTHDLAHDLVVDEPVFDQAEDPAIHVNNLVQDTSEFISEEVQTLITRASAILNSCSSQSQVSAAKTMIQKLQSAVKSCEHEHTNKFPKKTTKRKQELQSRSFIQKKSGGSQKRRK